jgi:hypothetical protein
MVKKEKASLWRIKHLLTRLSGDRTWIPCEIVETDSDIALFGDDRDKHRGNQLGKSIVKDDGEDISNGASISDEVVQQAGLLVAEAEQPVEAVLDEAKDTSEKAATETDITMTSTPQAPGMDAERNEGNDKLKEVGEGDDHPKASQEVQDKSTSITDDGPVEVEEAVRISEMQISDGTIRKQTLEEVETADAEEGADEEDTPAPHRMRTRAQAQADSDNTATSRTRSMSPDPSTEPFIHPYFLAPQKAHPDRDLGLPKHEAEETRRLLQLYIQKQEEVCRGAQKVYEGLLKADRYRHMVMKWAKAEAHVGVNRDMSDGEDWYDKEEWGLDEDLKKGHDEEEEDAATTAKKTRTRRQ